MGQFNELQQSLSTLDERGRGNEFERVCKWFLENSPEYALLLKKVWRWADWPARDGAEIGIDLVAETFAGDLWAIQAKYRSDSTDVRKAEVDSFLSAAGPRFAFRLLITSAPGLGTNARRALEGHGAGLLVRSDLDAAAVEWPSTFELLQPPAPQRLSPKPHQQEAVDAIASALSDPARAQVRLPCGTGKTLIGMWSWERLQPERTLVLLPSLVLLGQVLRSWAHNSERRFSFIVVCSDSSTVAQDELVGSPAQLGLPVTTDVQAVSRFLELAGGVPRVVFATYQSLKVVEEALRDTGRAMNLVIADEAHRTVGVSGRPFASVIDETLLPAERRLFMTATPRILTASSKRQALDAGLDIASMDDEAAYGPVVASMSFGEAVGRELLVDYQVARDRRARR